VTPVLDGNVARVTGASSGIDAAIATALAAQCAAVTLAARHEDRLEMVSAGKEASAVLTSVLLGGTELADMHAGLHAARADSEPH
jgi:NADP-dependent 3-hydroxy acid dehydrogenase YdfG